MDYSKYSKLIGSIVGNLVGVFLVWLAVKGVGTCSDISNVTTCSVFGFSYTQLTTAAMVLLSSATTYFAPANKITLSDGSQI